MEAFLEKGWKSSYTVLTMALLTEKSVIPETELKMLSGRFKEYLMGLPVYPS